MIDANTKAILDAFEEGMMKGLQLRNEEVEKLKQQHRDDLAEMAMQLDAMSLILGDQFEIGSLLMEYDRTTQYTVSIIVSDRLMSRPDYRELLQSIHRQLSDALLRCMIDKKGGVAWRNRENRQPLSKPFSST